MEIRQLEFFLAVAEEGSFTRGAGRLHSVQSAASAAVARLEREFGQRLFVRSGRRLELTEAGRTLLVRARSVQAEMNGARTDLDALGHGITGPVTLGTVLSFGTGLPAALALFHERYPRVAVQLRLSAGPIDEHLARIVDGTFDLALVPIPSRVPATVVMERVSLIRLCLVCPVGHPLADARGVRYRQLTGEPFVDFPPEWGNRVIVDDLFAAERCSRTVAIEVTDVASAVLLVAGGVGLAFVPEQSLLGRTDLVQVDLRRPPPAIQLGVVVSAQRPVSAAAQALFRVIVEHTSG